MTPQEAIDLLAKHKDADVRACAVIIREDRSRRRKILDIVQEAISQLRVDMKYLVFDLECTRKERDELMQGE